ncbi:uncharacterized protein LOC141528907 [Cotesia typhae]|uniref:uncharacterized protein LOC141528907 n=1 Tax=Cotesia typhae TaxID=2053667 RepID=UPI003D69BB45
MSSSRKRKHALIWWMKCKKTNVVELSLIPKKFQQVNAITVLDWIDADTKRKEKYEIKVLKIGYKEDLDNEMVTSEGELHDRSKKIFSSEVINNKGNATKRNKLLANLKSSQKRKVDIKIGNNQPIFQNASIVPPQNSQLLTLNPNLQCIQSQYLPWFHQNMQASLSNFYQSSSALQHPPTGQFSPVMTNNSSSLSQNQRPESKSSLLMSQMVPTINMKSPDICKPASSTITSGSEYIQDKSPSKKPANNLDNEKMILVKRVKMN